MRQPTVEAGECPSISLRTNGVAFTDLGKRDDLRGDGLFDVIIAVSNPQSDAGHFVRDAQDARGFHVEMLAVKEWGNWHDALLHVTGGSAVVVVRAIPVSAASHELSAHHRSG